MLNELSDAELQQEARELKEFVDLLDHFRLTVEARATIFTAFDLAERDPECDRFTPSAFQAWRRAALIPLVRADAHAAAVSARGDWILSSTLDAMSGYTTAPTRSEFLATLRRAEKRLRS